MCRTRQEIIQEEVEVQDLIDLKEKIERGEINGFDDTRKFYELVKVKSQIESTIREFQAMDDRTEIRTEVGSLKKSTAEAFADHYTFHKRSPSLTALFRKSPTGTVSIGGAFLVASSLFYVKETRDVIFSLVGLDSVAGQDLLNYGFPLFLFLLVTGVIAFVNSKDKKEEGE